MATVAPVRRTPTPWQNAVTGTALKADRECELLNTREKLSYCDTMSRFFLRKHAEIEEESRRAA